MTHFFNEDEAIEYGVNEAIVLSHIRFWIRKNMADGTNMHDGKCWTYGSTDSMAKIFPYWSSRQIRYALDALVDKGVLVVGEYNQSPFDRTKWYAFSDELHLTKLSTESGQNCHLRADKIVNSYKEEDIRKDRVKDIECASKLAPSSEDDKKHRSKQKTLQEWIDHERAAGKKLIPKDDPLFSIGYPDGYILLAWHVFVEVIKPTKRQLDWRQTFRNYVKLDYLKLWAMNRDKQYFLTTAGKQSAMRHNMGELING